MEKVLRWAVFGLAFLIVTAVIWSVTNFSLNSLRNLPVLFSAEAVQLKDMDRQLECMAMNIYREAANEPHEGKVGVAQVTLNRVNHPSFPKDVCRVVHQKTVVMDKVICQFSWYCDREHKAQPINRSIYEESYDVARQVLLQGVRIKVLEDALYYHADYVNPKWNKEKIGKIGTHIFYKDRS